MTLAVDVSSTARGPVTVAVHLNGNDTVVVIRPVDGKLHNRPVRPGRRLFYSEACSGDRAGRTISGFFSRIR